MEEQSLPIWWEEIGTLIQIEARRLVRGAWPRRQRCTSSDGTARSCGRRLMYTAASKVGLLPVDDAGCGPLIWDINLGHALTLAALDQEACSLSGQCRYASAW
jgi:hypothetical protein